MEMKEPESYPRRPLHQTRLGLQEIRAGAVFGLYPAQARIAMSALGQNLIGQSSDKTQIDILSGQPVKA